MSEGALCLIVSMSESQKGMYRIEVMFRRQDKGYVRAEVELEESEMEIKRQMEEIELMFRCPYKGYV